MGGTEILQSFERQRASEREVDQLTDRAQLLQEALHESEERAHRFEKAWHENEGLVGSVGDRLHDNERDLELVGRSPLWREAERLMVLRQRLTPGRHRLERGQLERIRENLAQVIRDLDARATGLPTTPALPPTRNEALPGGVTLHRAGPEPKPSSSRPTIAVIAWDVGHNPLVRAYIMAELLARRFDVEVWGAQFDRYGSRLWAPLQRPGVPIYFFQGARLPAHLDAMETVAERIDADAIWVSKPRFPSFALGALAKRARNRPLVLDVDDHELAFFGETEELELSQLSGRMPADLALPFERDWTRACEPLIAEADAVTVSNVALQQRHGGTLVPHARDETFFDPAHHDRGAARASLGIGPDDRLLLFGGTPRVHKGIVDVLEALERLGDSRYKLALIGTRELAELGDRLGQLRRWVLPLPYQRFSELASVVGAADLACVLQDPSHPVSAYQLPAKVTDALAMAVPCLVANLPPLRPLIDADVVYVHEPGTPLHERIDAILDDPTAAAARAERGRAYFLEHLSYGAVCNRVAPVFEGLLADPPPLSPALGDLVDAPRRLLSTTSSRRPHPR